MDADTLNRTEYTAAWPLASQVSADRPLGDGSAVAVLDSLEGWRRLATLVERTVGERPSGFVDETTFDTDRVIAFQTRVSSAGSRLQLRRIDGIETTEPELIVREVRVGPMQAAPTRVLLVRIPSVVATEAVVRYTAANDETSLVRGGLLT